MRLTHILTAAVITVLAANAPAEMPTLTDIPADYTLFARANSLAALKESAKPTLVYNASEFLWIAKAADGNRYFTHASVQLLKHAGKTEYVILNRGSKSDFNDGPFRARITATQTSAPQQLDGVGLRASAAILSVQPQLGTLYQFSIDRARAQQGIDEERILVMHDPDHSWRLVNVIRADSQRTSSGTTITTRVTTTATWTGLPDRPLSLAYHAANLLQEGSAKITVHESFIRAGTLPVASASARTRYVVIAKGDTLSSLSTRLAAWQTKFSGQSVTAGDMKRQLLALNPGLNPDLLRINAALTAPDLTRPPAAAATKTPPTPTNTPAPAIIAAEFPK